MRKSSRRAALDCAMRADVMPRRTAQALRALFGAQLPTSPPHVPLLTLLRHGPPHANSTLAVCRSASFSQSHATSRAAVEQMPGPSTAHFASRSLRHRELGGGLTSCTNGAAVCAADRYWTRLARCRADTSLVFFIRFIYHPPFSFAFPRRLDGWRCAFDSTRRFSCAMHSVSSPHSLDVYINPCSCDAHAPSFSLQPMSEEARLWRLGCH